MRGCGVILSVEVTAHAVSIKGSSALLDRCLVIDSHTKNTSWYTQNSYGAVSVEGGTVRSTLVFLTGAVGSAGI